MTDKTSRKNTDRRRLIVVIAGASAMIAATFGVQAIAESRLFQHAKIYAAETEMTNPFTQNASWGKHRGHRRGDWAKLSDEEIEKRINRIVRHVAVEIDATPEQTVKITSLLTAVAREMKPVHGDFHAAGEKIRDLLTASTIDRAALEKLRAERIADIDARSRQLVTAMADVAEVLTAEQRATLEKRVEEFRSIRRRWHRG